MLHKWIETNMYASPLQRVHALVPIISALFPDWAELWSADDVETTREGLQALQACMQPEGSFPDPSLVDLSMSCERVASLVAESAHTIDGDPGAGCAHLLTALLAAALFTASGRTGETFFTLDEVTASLADIVEMYPELDEPVRAAIRKEQFEV